MPRCISTIISLLNYYFPSFFLGVRGWGGVRSPINSTSYIFYCKPGRLYFRIIISSTSDLFQTVLCFKYCSPLFFLPPPLTTPSDGLFSHKKRGRKKNQSSKSSFNNSIGASNRSNRTTVLSDAFSPNNFSVRCPCSTLSSRADFHQQWDYFHSIGCSDDNSVFPFPATRRI